MLRLQTAGCSRIVIVESRSADNCEVVWNKVRVVVVVVVVVVEEEVACCRGATSAP